MKLSTQKVISGYGAKPGPFLLIIIAFGVDPMTGRGAALAAGHNFFTGWVIAIIGDMFFFLAMMFSILWLNNILGNGTWAAIIVMVISMGLPPVIRRIRQAIDSNKKGQLTE